MLAVTITTYLSISSWTPLIANFIAMDYLHPKGPDHMGHALCFCWEVVIAGHFIGGELGLLLCCFI